MFFIQFITSYTPYVVTISSIVTRGRAAQWWHACT